MRACVSCRFWKGKPADSIGICGKIERFFWKNDRLKDHGKWYEATSRKDYICRKYEVSK